MSITLGTNISALTAQRTLGRTGDALARTYERLSSGQRINRASDDAAGLAVSDRLNANARLYTVAQRNLSDAISSLSIMSGTLASQTELLGRLSELAEQSANGTFSTTQRKTLNAEYQALIKEFGRLGDTTTFNGLSLLRQGRVNEISDLIFQAGISGNSSSRLRLVGADTGTTSGTFNTASAATTDLNRDGTVDGADEDLLYNASFDQVLAAFGGDAFVSESKDSQGRTIQTVTGLYRNTASGDYIMGSFYEDLDQKSFIATTAFQTDYYYDRDIGVAPQLTPLLNINPTTGRVGGTGVVSVAVTDSSSINFNLSGIQFLSGSQTSVLETTDLLSISRARSALSLISQRRDQLSLISGNIGSVESRLTSAKSLVEVAGLTSTNAAGLIKDADIASESAQLTRQTILQQVAASVLAQANQQPQLALRLLAG